MHGILKPWCPNCHQEISISTGHAADVSRRRFPSKDKRAPVPIEERPGIQNEPNLGYRHTSWNIVCDRLACKWTLFFPIMRRAVGRERVGQSQDVKTRNIRIASLAVFATPHMLPPANNLRTKLPRYYEQDDCLNNNNNNSSSSSSRQSGWRLTDREGTSNRWRSDCIMIGSRRHSSFACQ